MRRKKRKVWNPCIILLISVGLMAGFTSCSPSPEQQGVKEYSRDFFALNTILSFKVYGGPEAEEALNQAVDRVHEIEERMSATIATSDVSEVNRNAGEKPVEVHEDTFYVVEKALEYGRMTHGDFDITIYPVSQLWGITSDHPRVPDKSEIDEKLKLVGYQNVVLDKDNKTIFLKKKGMGIELGAIAKGYAADEVAKILSEAQVKSALINMGGNVLVMGSKTSGQPWRIGIQDPRSDETGQNHVGILKAVNQTIVSSGDYERYIVDVYKKTGVRYHHIFDPKTGYPARTGLMGTTVVAEKSIDADALSTSLFIMGAEKGLALINEIEGVQGLAITEDKKIYATDGLRNSLEITNKEYAMQP